MQDFESLFIASANSAAGAESERGVDSAPAISTGVETTAHVETTPLPNPEPVREVNRFSRRTRPRRAPLRKTNPCGICAPIISTSPVETTPLDAAPTAQSKAAGGLLLPPHISQSFEDREAAP
jgi:hypothetical protein